MILVYCGIYLCAGSLAPFFDIKLIFWGENPALQVGDSLTGGFKDPFDGNNLRYLNTLVEGGEDWMDDVFDSIHKKEN